MKGREIRQIPEIDIPIRNTMGQFKMYTKYLEQNKVLRVEKNDHTTGDKPIMEALNEGRGTKKTILESARKKVKALKIDDVNPDSLVTSAAEALKQQRDSGK